MWTGTCVVLWCEAQTISNKDQSFSLLVVFFYIVFTIAILQKQDS